jgi:hypothetical protein
LVTVKEGDLVTNYRFTKIDDAHAFGKAQRQVNSGGRVGVTKPERRKVSALCPHGPTLARAHDLREPKA